MSRRSLRITTYVTLALAVPSVLVLAATFFGLIPASLFWPAASACLVLLVGAGLCIGMDRTESSVPAHFDHASPRVLEPSEVFALEMVFGMREDTLRRLARMTSPGLVLSLAHPSPVGEISERLGVTWTEASFIHSSVLDKLDLDRIRS